MTEQETNALFFGIPKQYRRNAHWYWIGSDSALRRFLRWCRAEASQ